MTSMTIKDKLDFLADVEKAIKMVCGPLNHNRQPTSANAHNYDKEQTNMITDMHHDNAILLIEKLKDINHTNKNDGNHHKLGKYMRKKANILHEAALELTQIEEPNKYKFNTRKIKSKWFELTNMTFIASQIDEKIFKNDIKNLKPFSEKFTVK